MGYGRSPSGLPWKRSRASGCRGDQGGGLDRALFHRVWIRWTSRPPIRKRSTRSSLSAHLGPVRVARITCGRSSIARTPRHIVHAPGRVFSFILQARGRGVLRSIRARGAAARRRHHALRQRARLTRYHVEEHSEVMMLRVPANHAEGTPALSGAVLRAASSLDARASPARSLR